MYNKSNKLVKNENHSLSLKRTLFRRQFIFENVKFTRLFTFNSHDYIV